MRDEISAGLKNALERGESLDKAVQTFINSGYNPVEVKEAAKNVGSGASTIVKETLDMPSNELKTNNLMNNPSFNNNSNMNNNSNFNNNSNTPMENENKSFGIQPLPKNNAEQKNPLSPLEKKRKEKKIIILIIILGVLLLAILTIAILFGGELFNFAFGK